MVSRDVIPNNDKEYKKLGDVINNGRLAGLIDWERIEDRLRVPKSNAHWDDPKEIIDSAAAQYTLSKWDNQDSYIEVYCEKDAVSNILEPVCQKWDVLFLANRGYLSQSAMYRAHRRFKNRIRKGGYVLYLGDHDPSGIDMSEDIERRLDMMCGNAAPTVKRIALNMDQVNKYNPPENPAKLTDSRAAGYIKRFGYSSWELDALEPKVLSELLSSHIERLVDKVKFEAVKEEESKGRDKIRGLSKYL